MTSYLQRISLLKYLNHDDVIKWRHFPHYWPFVWGIHRSPVNSLHKDQWRRVLMFSLICAWRNCWVNAQEAGDLSHHAHYDITVMTLRPTQSCLVHSVLQVLGHLQLQCWSQSYNFILQWCSMTSHRLGAIFKISNGISWILIGLKGLSFELQGHFC